jgi:hypothetical protein
MEQEDKDFWIKVYKTAKVGVSPLKAKDIADRLTNERIETRKATITNGLNTLRLDIQDHGGEILIRDDDGEYYFDAVLMGIDEHIDGKRISPELLQKWTDHINENGLVADVDHLQIKKLIERGYTPQKIKDYMKSKPGIAKTVKAYFEDGVLRIRAWIDKRYQSIMKKVKGLSLESFVQYDDNDPNLAVDGDLFGFTFNVNTSPAYLGAKIEQ